MTRLKGDAPHPRSQIELNSVISELALSLEEAISREKALSEVLRIISPATGLGRMDARRDVINIIDVKSEDIYRTDEPLRYATAVLGGARSFVATPMLAADKLGGAFTVYRQTVRPFSDDTTRFAQKSTS